MYYKHCIHLLHQKQTNKMTTLTISATVLFKISLIGFILGLIVLILPTLKKVVINLSTLALILAVLFINLIKDITKAIKYVTIG